MTTRRSTPRPDSAHRFILPLVVLLALFLASAASAAPRVHVEIDDGDDLVSLALPLSLVQGAAQVLPTKFEVEAHVHVDDAEISLGDLRTLWHDVRTSPDDTLVEITTRDGEHVTLTKHDGMLELRTRDRFESVDMEIPLEVVDALFDAPDDHLDIAGALTALAALSDGPVLTIRDGADSVRVWIED